MNPRFAVVGHPNKGKSSIVATLAQNDGIAIALEPGTTQTNSHYSLRVDEHLLYDLIDTPGFQRPRKVLAWLQAHSLSASDRPDTVRAFVTQHHDDPRFHDECQLLAPILDGAGILYVVDGAVPYNREQEAEMEILRWTGQPSLALINRIGDGDHLASWRAALGQYFQIVRDFDAVHAPFENHLDLLHAFGQLAPGWSKPLEQAATYLRQQRHYRQQQSLQLIATALADMLGHQQRLRHREDGNRNALEHQLQRQWRDWQRQREQRLRRDVEALYRHHHLTRQEQALGWQPDSDLFSQQARRTWGVSRAYLVTAGFGAGALGGASIDALTAGHSLGAGALIGGVLGATSSAFYGGKYAHKLGHLKGLEKLTGGPQTLFGPVRDPQFGYVVLGRALEHWYQVSHRNHAGRTPLTLDNASQNWLEHLSRGQRQRLQKALQSPPRQVHDGRRQALLESAIEQAGSAFLSWRQEQPYKD